MGLYGVVSGSCQFTLFSLVTKILTFDPLFSKYWFLYICVQICQRAFRTISCIKCFVFAALLIQFVIVLIGLIVVILLPCKY